MAKMTRKQLAALAQAKSEEAIAALTAVMRDAETAPAARISAANALLQWGHGKATEAQKKAPPETREQIVRLYWGPE
jgi:hypothetical protein